MKILATKFVACVDMTRHFWFGIFSFGEKPSFPVLRRKSFSAPGNIFSFPPFEKKSSVEVFFLAGGLKLSDRRDCQDILSCDVRADFKVLMRASLSKDILLSHLLSQSFLFEKAPFKA